MRIAIVVVACLAAWGGFGCGDAGQGDMDGDTSVAEPSRVPPVCGPRYGAGWRHHVGPGILRAIATDADGNVFTSHLPGGAGSNIVKWNAAGEEQARVSVDGNVLALVVTNSGEIVLGGMLLPEIANGQEVQRVYDAWVAKLDDDLALLWAVILPGEGANSEVEHVVVSPSGVIWTLGAEYAPTMPKEGETYSSFTSFVGQVSGDGASVWRKSFGAADGALAPMSLGLGAGEEAIVVFGGYRGVHRIAGVNYDTDASHQAIVLHIEDDTSMRGRSLVRLVDDFEQVAFDRPDRFWTIQSRHDTNRMVVSSIGEDGNTRWERKYSRGNLLLWATPVPTPCGDLLVGVNYNEDDPTDGLPKSGFLFVQFDASGHLVREVVREPQPWLDAGQLSQLATHGTDGVLVSAYYSVDDWQLFRSPF